MLCSADEGIVKEFENAGVDMTNYAQKQGSTACDYRIKDNRLRNDLEGLKLYGCDAFNKAVPDFYKFGSIGTRWAILQGLMDTDGSVDKRGHCSFATVSEQLAKDVKFLVNSLGGLATVNKRENHYVSKQAIIMMFISELISRSVCSVFRERRCFVPSTTAA